MNYDDAFAMEPIFLKSTRRKNVLFRGNLRQEKCKGINTIRRNKISDLNEWVRFANVTIR